MRVRTLRRGWLASSASVRPRAVTRSGTRRRETGRRSSQPASFPASRAASAAHHWSGDEPRRQQLAPACHLAPHAEAHQVRAHAGTHGDHHPARRGAHRGGEVDRPGGNDAWIGIAARANGLEGESVQLIVTLKVPVPVRLAVSPAPRTVPDVADQRTLAPPCGVAEVAPFEERTEITLSP
jgi:hypothetical protein